MRNGQFIYFIYNGTVSGNDGAGGRSDVKTSEISGLAFDGGRQITIGHTTTPTINSRDYPLMDIYQM